MWRLRIGAKVGDDPHLFSTNNYVGRQTWEFDAYAGSPEELAEVDEARRSSYGKPSADLLWRMQVNLLQLVEHIQKNKNWFTQQSIILFSEISKQFLREKKFEQKIPRVNIKDSEKITYEDAKTALRRGVLYFSALQADDGHWPSENGGSFFFDAPFVSLLLSLFAN